MDVNIVVALDIHDQAHDRRHDLSNNGGHSSAGHAHPGCAAQSKDQNGVHDDVDDGAQQLGAHGQTGTAGGLQQPLKAELAENTHGKT